MTKWLLIFGLLSPILSFGQFQVYTPQSTQGYIEAGSYSASAEQTPFWLRANQYGIVPLKPAPGYIRGGLIIPYRTTRKRLLDWGAGADVVANAGPFSGNLTPTVLIPELYVKARLGLLEIYAGRRREMVGLVDSTLSSGSYSWSGNALPMPKIQISLRDYAPIPFTKGVLSVKGTFAHGWFPATGFVDHSYLHQSSLYGRLGKLSWPVRFYAGFNHQVQWGGTTTNLPNGYVENGGKFPGSFKDYLNVITGSSLGTHPNPDPTQYSSIDAENRVGNHLGTIDVAMEVQVQKLSFFAYRQSIYEDGSLFYLTNITDGLHGLRIRNLRPSQHGIALTNVLLEYLDTRSQGGDKFVDNVGKLRGRDNYFNHSQYRDGWSYYGQTIGTPFIPPANTTILPPGSDRFTNDNRVQAYQLGVSGQIGGIVSFQTKLVYSLNYGSYPSPVSPAAGQFSGGLWVSAPLSARHGLNLTASLAVDRGNLYPDNVGGAISLRKTWVHDRDRLKGSFTSADTAQTPKPAVALVTKSKPQPAQGQRPVVATKRVIPSKPAVVVTAKAPASKSKEVVYHNTRPVVIRSENSPMRSSDFPVIESRSNSSRTPPRR